MSALPPILDLFDYQRNWIDDDSPLKVIVKGRQIGITFCETLDIVFRLIARKTPWYYLSISEERAAEAIAYAATHCLALGVGVELIEDVMEFERVKYKALRLEFPNGSKLVGLAANPRTARGAAGNLTLDEFGHHVNADAIWRGASPVTTWGFMLRVISTPNGRQGKYYNIWTGNRSRDPEEIEEDIRAGRQPIKDGWSRHLVNILDAKAAGHPVDLARAREVAGTDDDWLQEYMCAFLDEAYSWIPYELIDRATQLGERFGACTSWGDWKKRQHVWGPCYGGFDVGRTSDKSVLWITEKRPRTLQLITRTVLPLDGTRFKAQREIIDDHMPLVRKFAIDSSSIGIQLAEELEEKWKSRVEGVKFSGDNPARLAAIGKKGMESGKVCLPDDEIIRRDFHSVRRVFTKGGKASWQAPHTKDGHADRWWAYCLSLYAADQHGDVMRAGDYEATQSRKHNRRSDDDERKDPRDPVY